MKIRLPMAEGKSETYHLVGEPIAVRKPKAPFNRVVFAAAHVVADPLSAIGALDWDRTLKFRHYLMDQGFGIAEAMDTSQRGIDRKSTRLNSSHIQKSRMPSSA